MGRRGAIAGQVPRFIREAARRSVTGTPGPVYLGIPGEVFEEEIADYQPPAPGERVVEMPLLRPAPTAADVDAVVARAAPAPIGR